MSDESEVLDIRLRLQGQVKAHFLQIKDAKGLTNNTEVLRLLINEYLSVHEILGKIAQKLGVSLIGKGA